MRETILIDEDPQALADAIQAKQAELSRLADPSKVDVLKFRAEDAYNDHGAQVGVAAAVITMMSSVAGCNWPGSSSHKDKAPTVAAAVTPAGSTTTGESLAQQAAGYAKAHGQSGGIVAGPNAKKPKGTSPSPAPAKAKPTAKAKPSATNALQRSQNEDNDSDTTARIATTPAPSRSSSQNPARAVNLANEKPTGYIDTTAAKVHTTWNAAEIGLKKSHVSQSLIEEEVHQIEERSGIIAEAKRKGETVDHVERHRQLRDKVIIPLYYDVTFNSKSHSAHASQAGNRRTAHKQTSAEHSAKVASGGASSQLSPSPAQKLPGTRNSATGAKHHNKHNHHTTRHAERRHKARRHIQSLVSNGLHNSVIPVGGKNVLATFFTDSGGAYGPLTGRWGFAELGSPVSNPNGALATRLGGLAPHTKVAISEHGRTAIAEKLDFGGDLNNASLDEDETLATYLHNGGKDEVHVTLVPQSTPLGPWHGNLPLSAHHTIHHRKAHKHASTHGISMKPLTRNIDRGLGDLTPFSRTHKPEVKINIGPAFGHGLKLTPNFMQAITHRKGHHRRHHKWNPPRFHARFDWPLTNKNQAQHNRPDEGYDIWGVPGARIRAIQSGYMYMSNPNPGGFGNDYPTERLDRAGADLPSQYIYYGHIHAIGSLIGKHVHAGQVIGYANTYHGQNGSEAPAGWLEIGFASGTSGAPVERGIPSSAGLKMRWLMNHEAAPVYGPNSH